MSRKYAGTNRRLPKSKPPRDRSLPPIVTVVGYSGSGKTTFLEKLIPELKRLGFTVGTVKHDVHGFEIDRPGKDSYRLKHAGAAVTVISSPFQIGMVKDVDHDHTPEELAALMADVDIVLMEGYKTSEAFKLEIFRPEISAKPFCPPDDRLLALISDAAVDAGVPRFGPRDVHKVARLLVERFQLSPARPPAPPN